MPKNKVLCLKDKVKICEDSQKPGFSKEKCIIDYDIKRNTLNKLLQNKEKFLKFNNSQSLNSKQKHCIKGKNFEILQRGGILGDTIVLCNRKYHAVIYIFIVTQ